MMNFVYKMMNFVLEMMRFALKMMNLALKLKGPRGYARSLPTARTVMVDHRPGVYGRVISGRRTWTMLSALYVHADD